MKNTTVNNVKVFARVKTRSKKIFISPIRYNILSGKQRAALNELIDKGFAVQFEIV